FVIVVNHPNFTITINRKTIKVETRLYSIFKNPIMAESLHIISSPSPTGSRLGNPHIAVGGNCHTCHVTESKRLGPVQDSFGNIYSGTHAVPVPSCVIPITKQVHILIQHQTVHQVG